MTRYSGNVSSIPPNKSPYLCLGNYMGSLLSFTRKVHTSKVSPRLTFQMTVDSQSASSLTAKWRNSGVCALEMSTADFKKNPPSGEPICRQLRGDSVCSGNASHGIEYASCCSRLSPTHVKSHLFKASLPLLSSTSYPPKARIWMSVRNCWPWQITFSLVPLPKAPENSQTFDLAENHGIIWMRNSLLHFSSFAFCFSPSLSRAALAPSKEKLGYKMQGALLGFWSSKPAFFPGCHSPRSRPYFLKISETQTATCFFCTLDQKSNRAFFNSIFLM